MFDPELFDAEVDEHFAFLVREFGFTREPLKLAGPECWVVFKNPSAQVIITQETGAPCWVTLHDTQAEGSGNRVEFGLHELQLEAKRRGASTGSPRASANLHQEIRALAEDLLALGRDVLRGDFTVLRERHARHRAATHRNHSTS